MADAAWGENALPFLAIGRVRDSKILGQYVNIEQPEQRQQLQDVFAKLLSVAAVKLTAGQRTRLSWNEGAVCVLMDSAGANMYCVVTQCIEYPERLAYQLLYDLVAEASKEDLAGMQAHGLDSLLGQTMRELVQKYEDATGSWSDFRTAQSCLEVEGVEAGMSSTKTAEPGQGRAKQVCAACFLLLVIVGVLIYAFLFNGQGGTGEGQAQAAEKLTSGLASLAVVMDSAHRHGTRELTSLV